MPTPAERQALLFVAAVAALGVGARSWQALHRAEADPTARAALAAQIALVDSAVTAGGAAARRRIAPAPVGPATSRPRTTRPSRRRAPPEATAASPSAVPTAVPPTGPIDVDVADAEMLDRLPGIGPALAQRIVEDRASRGPFGSLEALERVRGIGPALAARLRDHVTFSGAPRHSQTEVPLVRRGVRP